MIDKKKSFLVLENDIELDESFLKFVDGLRKQSDKLKIIYNAAVEPLDELTKAFEEYEVLIINPTLITFAQYNLMMMLMYSLICEGTLKIRELYIYHFNDNKQKALSSLWDKRKHLDKVLSRVRIYDVKEFLSTSELFFYQKDEVCI